MAGRFVGTARLLLLGLVVGAAGPGPEPDPAPVTPQALEQARTAESQLQGESVAAASRLREADTALADAAQQVALLAERQRQAELALGRHTAEIAPLLPLAERLSLFPAETMLAVPTSPERAVQGLAVLRGLMRGIEVEASGLRAELASVAAAKAALDAALPQLRAAQAEQARRSALLDRQLAEARARRSKLEDAAAEQAKRAAVEADRADTVGEALQTMDASRARTQVELQQDVDRAERQRRPGALETAKRRQAQIAAQAGPGVVSGAVIPAAGQIVRHWGEETEAGPAHGMVFRPPPKGRVVSPCQGRVVFAAPFRSYGLLVIVDCGKSTHFVLSGFARLDVDPGDPVAMGQPLGVMADWDPAGGGARPSLYVELRRAGHPVDPAPFFRAPS